MALVGFAERPSASMSCWSIDRTVIIKAMISENITTEVMMKLNFLLLLED